MSGLLHFCSSRVTFALLTCASLALVPACQSSVSEDCDNPEHAEWCTLTGDEAPSEEATETGGAVCEALDPEAESGQGITITVRNDRAAIIYLPWFTSGCTWELISMSMAGERVFWDGTGAYIPSCDTLLGAACSFGCSDGPANMLKLEPGATYDIPWAGYVWAETPVPTACAEASGCTEGSTCWAGRQLDSSAAQALDMRVRVAESCDLETCTCDGDACLLTQDSLSIEGVASTEESFAVSYDGADVVLAIGE